MQQVLGKEELPSCDSPDKQGVRDAELNDGIQLLSPLLQELIQLQQKTLSSEGQRHSQGTPVSREGEDVGAVPEQELKYHFGLLHRAWEAVQEEAVFAGRGVEVVLNQLHHHLIAHLQREERQVHGQKGHPSFTHSYLQSCCTHASAQPASQPFYSRSWCQRQQLQHRALL